MGEPSIDVMRKEFDKRRQYMVKMLNTFRGIECLSPQGAFYAFPKVSALFGKQSKTGVVKNSADFCNLLLKEALVACVPGSGFGADEHIRLSYATSMKDIEAGLARIKSWVAELV
jgi:aspartate aminotransferase